MEDELDIAAEAVRYFEELFSEPEMASTELLDLISDIVTGEDNGLLEACPTLEEVE